VVGYLGARRLRAGGRGAWGTRNQVLCMLEMGLRQPRLRQHGGRRAGASYRGGESWRPRPRELAIELAGGGSWGWECVEYGWGGVAEGACYGDDHRGWGLGRLGAGGWPAVMGPRQRCVDQEDETLGLGYTGAAERAGSGARLAWEVAESAWHGGDHRGLGAEGWQEWGPRAGQRWVHTRRADFEPSYNVENGSCSCQC